MSNTSLKEMLLEKKFKRAFNTRVEEEGIGYYEYWGATFYDPVKSYLVGTATLIFADVNETEEEVEYFFDEYSDELTDIALGDGELREVEICDISTSYEYGVVNFSIDFYAS